MLWWLLGALPNDNKLHLSIAIGCGIYSILPLAEITASTPEISVSADSPAPSPA